MNPSGSSSESGSNSNSLLGGWGGDWGKKLTDGVAEVRKQVTEANLTPPKQPQSSSSAASDVEALKKRVGLLEGVIKKLIPVKGDPSKLAELWEKGVNDGKQIEILREENDRHDKILQQYEARLETITIELSAKEAELQKAKDSVTSAEVTVAAESSPAEEKLIDFGDPSDLEMRTLKERISSLEDNGRIQRDVLATVEQELSEKNAKIADLQREIEKAVNSAEQDKLVSLEQEVSEKNTRIESLQMELENANATAPGDKLEALEEELSEKNAKIASLQTEIETVDEEAGRDKLSVLEQEISEKNARIASLEAEVESYISSSKKPQHPEQEILEKDRRIASLESELEKANASPQNESLEALEQELSEKKAKIECLEMEIGTVDDSAQRDKLTTFEHEMSEKNATIASLQTEIEDMREREQVEKRSVGTNVESNVSEVVENATGIVVTSKTLESEALRESLEEEKQRSLSGERKVEELNTYIANLEQRFLEAQETLRRELEETPDTKKLRDQTLELQNRLEETEKKAAAEFNSVTDKLKASYEKVNAAELALRNAQDNASMAVASELNMNNKLEELQAKNVTIEKQLRNVTQSLNDREKQVSVFHDKTEEMINERERQIKESKIAADKKVKELKRSLDAAEKRIKAIGADEESARDAHLAAEARCTSALEELESLQKTIAEKTRRVEDLESELSTERLRIGDIQNELAQKEREFTKFKDKAKLAVGQRDTAIADLRSEVSSARDREAKLSESNAEREESLEVLGKLEEQLKESTAELDGMQSKAGELDRALTESEERANTLSRKLEVELEKSAELEKAIVEEKAARGVAATEARLLGERETEKRNAEEIAALNVERGKLMAKLKGVQNELRRLQANRQQETSLAPSGTPDPTLAAAAPAPSSNAEPGSVPKSPRRAREPPPEIEIVPAKKDWEKEARDLQTILERVTIENIQLKQNLSKATTRARTSEGLGDFLAI
ncbi:hypothetical protein NDN08_001655 [Rhodosorus marinus]|uniref:Uncharacterized protein n=1 Tax=Rhodosorus marinus TaxID=101924 RepID=A0AAV8URG8_9RHOD|nr:hypothetical protein NDN08_001655 [Rhodosorus marinus]